MNFLLRVSVMVYIFLIGVISNAFAVDPTTAMNDFSTQAETIFKGPIAKILGAAVLLTGVASLLRGRHRLAISCGVAFIMLLFFPILLAKVTPGP